MRVLLIICCLLPSFLHAQHETGDSFLRLSFDQQVRKGVVRFMTFHNHNPQYNIRSDYHQHLYYQPFDEAKEYNQQISLQGQYYLNTRTGIQFTFPYTQQRRQFLNGDSQTKKGGIGDISVHGLYQLYNSRLFQLDTRTQRQQHIFLLKMGGRIPTGKFANFDELNELEPHLQPGMGSWAADIGLYYIWQTPKTWEGEVLIQTRYHFPNTYTFQQGQYYQLHALVQYPLPLLKKWQLIPKFALQGHFWGQDQLNEKPIVEETQRQWYATMLGLQLRNQRSSIALHYAFPFLQSWEGIQLKQQGTLSFQCTFYLAKAQPIISSKLKSL